MQPVFIMGGSRTGSELTKSLLRRYTEVDQIPEMWLACPRWLHSDLRATAKKEMGGIDNYKSVAEMLDLLYSRKPFGVFWSCIADEIDRDRLGAALERNERSLKGLLTALLEAHAEQSNKKVPGAKFPMHYSWMPKMMEWFPDCRIVHTTRDPRAIFASQAEKHRRGRRGAAIIWSRAQQFLHINIQFWWSAHIHEEIKNRSNYYLLRYEDLVSEPEKNLVSLCNFLGIEFNEELLTPRLANNSSFRTTKTEDTGIKNDSLEAWRDRLAPGTIRVISGLQRRNLISMGYV